MTHQLSKELAALFRKVTNSHIDEEGNAHCVLTPADNIAINSARALLAKMEQEPVAWRYRTTNLKGEANPDWSFSEEASSLGLYQPLYAHPAPSIPAAVPECFAQIIRHLQNAHDFIENTEAFGGEAVTGIIQCGGNAWNIDESKASINACRAAMLQAEPKCTCPSGDGSLRWPCPVHPPTGNSPVIPDDWKLVPVDATRAMIDAARRVEEEGYDAMHKAMIAAAPKLE